MLYFDTRAQIAIAVGFLLTNNMKKFMSKILAILAKILILGQDPLYLGHDCQDHGQDR